MSLSCDGWVGTASFSNGEKYRYVLTRSWNDGDGCCTFIMLNPSTATGEVNDPTIRRCIGYARRWGHDQLRIVNLFALRSTDPKKLYQAVDPVGPENDASILFHCLEAKRVVCAWGVHGVHMNRGNVVLKMLSDARILPEALAKTKAGIPKHPLYLKSDLTPTSIA